MNKKIIDYGLIIHGDPLVLQKNVNDAIKAGAQPIGGLCISSGQENGKHWVRYSQAMVKYADK